MRRRGSAAVVARAGLEREFCVSTDCILRSEARPALRPRDPGSPPSRKRIRPSGLNKTPHARGVSSRRARHSGLGWSVLGCGPTHAHRTSSRAAGPPSYSRCAASCPFLMQVLPPPAGEACGMRLDDGMRVIRPCATGPACHRRPGPRSLQRLRAGRGTDPAPASDRACAREGA